MARSLVFERPAMEPFDQKIDDDLAQEMGPLMMSAVCRHSGPTSRGRDGGPRLTSAQSEGCRLGSELARLGNLGQVRICPLETNRLS